MSIAAYAGAEAIEESLAQTREHTLVTTVPIVLKHSDDQALGRGGGDPLDVNACRRYESDGVVVLPKCIGLNWVEALREAIDRDIHNPGPNVHLRSFVHKDGDVLDSDQYPVVWPHPRATA